MFIRINRRLWWDYSNGDGVRYQETIEELIDQFNFVGYNDLCNYPPKTDMTDIKSDYQTKGVEYVHYGHAERNQTGMELNNNLYTHCVVIVRIFLSFIISIKPRISLKFW